MVSNKDTIAKIKKLYPDVKITMLPVLGNAKGIGNPQKVAEMKEILSKVKYPLPTRG
jgi:hypothetical protein